MSLIKTIKQQLGLSVTPANNFCLDASADNGTMKLSRESGEDIMTVDAAGYTSQSPKALTFPWPTISNSGANTLDAYREEPSYFAYVTPSIGAFSNATNTTIFTRVGRLCTVQSSITLTDIGTGSGLINFTLPFPAEGYAIGCGRRLDNGDQLQVICMDGSVASIFKYDNTVPMVNGAILTIAITYRVQEGY